MKEEEFGGWDTSTEETKGDKILIDRDELIFIMSSLANKMAEDRNIYNRLRELLGK